MEFSKVNVIDSRLVSQSAECQLFRGPSSISKNINSVTGAPNTSSLQFNIPINTVGTATDLNFYGHYKVYFKVTVTNASNAPITGGAGGTPLLVVGSNVSLAPYPMSTLFTSASVLVNEKQVMSYDMSNYSQLLMRLNDSNKLIPDALGAAMIEQSFASYIDSYLCKSNPMATYADCEFGTGQIPNGAWNITFDAQNTIANAVTLAAGASRVVGVYCELWEPLIIAPFSFANTSDGNDSSPYYLRNITVNLPIGSLNRFFRFGGSTILPNYKYTDGTANTNIAVAGSLTVSNLVWDTTQKGGGFDTAELHWMSLQPPLVSSFSLPSQSIIHTFNTVCNNVVGPQFPSPQTPNVRFPINMNNITLSGMPRYCVIGCKKDKDAYDPTQATFYFPVVGLNISLGNQQSLIASYNAQDLFRASKRNGLRQDFLSWSGNANSVDFANANTVNTYQSVQTCSGPVILEFGRDIPLEMGVVNGSSGSFTLSFIVNVLDTEKRCSAGLVGAIPNLYVMFIYDSWLVTDARTGMSDLKQSIIAPGLALEPAPIASEADVHESEIVGGVLHKMARASGAPSNLSKAQAMSKLSKRLTF